MSAAQVLPASLSSNATQVDAAAGDTFSLSILVRDVLTTEPDPDLAAAEVLRRIPADLTGEALAQCLRAYVSVTATQVRMESTRRTNGAPTHGKATQQRDWMHQLLRSSWFTPGGHKFFSDLTQQDCEAIASSRRIEAAKNTAQAERFDRLAKALADAGAGTVKRLKPAAVALAWGGEQE